MRRVVSAFILSSFLALGPTAAWAGSYPAPEVAVTVDLPGSVATVGVPFNVWIPADDGVEVVLTIDDGTDSDERPPVEIAGVHTHTKYAANGGASFAVTIAAAGTFTIRGHVDGVMVLAMQIGAEHDGVGSAGGGGASSGAGDVTGQGGADATGGITAESGGVVSGAVSSSEAVFYGIGAVLLMGAGAALVVRARRRREPAQ